MRDKHGFTAGMEASRQNTENGVTADTGSFLGIRCSSLNSPLALFDKTRKLHSQTTKVGSREIKQGPEASQLEHGRMCSGTSVFLCV